MHMLAIALLVLGIVAFIGGFCSGFYVFIYGWAYANPRDHTNPDWLTVAWRLYWPQIIALLVLTPTGFALRGLATLIHKHAS